MLWSEVGSHSRRVRRKRPPGMELLRMMEYPMAARQRTRAALLPLARLIRKYGPRKVRSCLLPPLSSFKVT